MLLFLKYRWRMLFNTLHISSGKQKYTKLAGLAGLLFLFGYLFYLSSRFLEYALTTSGWEHPELLIQNGTAILFNGVFLLLFFNSITGTAKGLFESPEMQLLFSLPIRFRTVVTIKIFDQAFRNATSFGILGLGALTAFAFQADQPLLFCVAILPAALFFILIPTSIGLIITFLISRFFSGPRLRGMGNTLSTLSALGLWFLLHNLQSQLEEPGEKVTYLQQITNFNGLSNTPAGWLSRSASAFLFPNQSGWLPFLMLFLTALISLFLCTRVMKHHYLKFGATSPEQSASLKSSNADPITKNNITTALITKDLRLLKRDSRLIMQLFISIVVMLFISYRTGNSLKATILILNPENISFFSAASVMLAIIAARAASMLSPLESYGYWLLKTTPIVPKKIFRAKLLLALIVTEFAIGLCLVMLLIVHHITFVTAVLLWIHFSLLALLMCSLGIWMGIAFGNPDWDHPKRMLNPRGQLLLPVLGVIGAVMTVFSWWGLSAVIILPAPLNNIVALTVIGIFSVLISRIAQTKSVQHFVALEPKL